MYYISKSLQEAEVKYLPLEKAILAIIHATKKLPHYFQAHTVIILTQLPLQALLRKSDYIGRVAKWGTMLNALVFASNGYERLDFGRFGSIIYQEVK